MSNQDPLVGNYQYLYFVPGDFLQSFDPPTPYNQPIMLGPVTPTLISGIEEVFGDPIEHGQIVLNAPADGGQYYAAFWIEIRDDLASKGTFVHANVWGKMYLDDGSQNAFPQSDLSDNNVNIIPLAIVAASSTPFSNGDNYRIEQFCDGNLVNLYDGMYNNAVVTGTTSGLAVGSKAIFRGDWTNDNLSGQWFYPGDIVRDVGTAESVVNNAPYVCLVYLNATVAPSADPSSWLPLVD